MLVAVPQPEPDDKSPAVLNEIAFTVSYCKYKVSSLRDKNCDDDVLSPPLLVQVCVN